MERHWTNIGKEFNGDDEKKALLSKHFEALEWEEAAAGKEVCFMAGYAINEAIKRLKMPRVSHIAISNSMAPIGLYGIRAHYKNGVVNAYLIDTGTEVIPVAQDFYPVETNT